MLALNVVLPLIAVQCGLHAELSPVIALLLSALCLLAETVLGCVQSRTVCINRAVSLTR